MRYRLRTLLIVLALGPPVLGGMVAIVRELTRPIEFFCGSHIKSPGASPDENRSAPPGP